MKTRKPIVRRRVRVPGRAAHRRIATAATRFYAALIHKESRGGYGVVFPDLPGCTSAGDTLDEALLNAQDALQGHIEVTAEYGDAIPAPTPIHRLRLGAADKRHLVHVQLVPVVMPGKAVKVMVSLDGGLLSRIDAVAGHYGRSRFLAEAARSKLTGGVRA